MRSFPRHMVPGVLLSFGLLSCVDETIVRDGGRDSSLTDVAGDRVQTEGGFRDVGPIMCVDSDNDTISDAIESQVDTDSDGRPDSADTDSDDDGFLDNVEVNRNYPGYESSVVPGYVCGILPDDCDGDRILNFRDTDSDNDGLADSEEIAARTNPCAADSDGDMVSDLIEVAARSDPRDAASKPPTNALYVTLPYSTPEHPQDHVVQEFRFQTRIRSADVMFMVDTTASMQTTIDTLRNTLMQRIIPGIRDALMGGEARFGVADFRDLPTMGYGASADWIVRVRQKLDTDAARSLAAVGMMRAAGGGDWPEAQLEAIFQTLEGAGIVGHETDVTPSLSTGGQGWAGPVNPTRDCGATSTQPSYGWGCFSPGRVPILLVFSDADWHNGPGNSFPYDASIRGLQAYNTVRARLRERGAYVVGIDVGQGSDTMTIARQLAMETGTLNGMAQPIAFNNPGGGATVADNVVSAVQTLAQQTRQDITTGKVADPAETRIVVGRNTADFILSVVPARGIPDAPTGYDRKDTTTFFNVSPSTEVVFSVDFFNDFQPGGPVAQLFQATILVLGRAGAEVDRRPVYIIVPSEDATIRPG